MQQQEKRILRTGTGFFFVCLGSRTVFDGKLGDVEEGEEDGENFMNHEFEIMLATSFISRKNSEEMVHWC